MSKISKIFAREILDSRGNPTVEVEVELENGVKAQAAVPSGASTGTFEALELRDQDLKRYNGLGVLTAVKNVNEVIAPRLVGLDAEDQRGIDDLMIKLDGTENKSKLGANAILAVSLAVCRVSALDSKLPLYAYISKAFELRIEKYKTPVPMFNIINGGKHSDSGLSIQEYKIIPNGVETFREQYRAGAEIFQALKKILTKMGHSVAVGDEGGFAPRLGSNHEPLELINEAIEKAGYKPGKQVNIGIDVAANSFMDEVTLEYVLMPENKRVTEDNLISLYSEWIDKYNIISVEDGLGEQQWDGWKKMQEKIGGRVLNIGDDLLVTNVKRLQKAIDMNACNAVIIKVNQIGTVSEAIDCINLAKSAGIKRVISHRSGETVDDFIADLAVGSGAEYMKSGSLSRSERNCKYNRLLRIEEEI